jgi:hypothetical protein
MIGDFWMSFMNLFESFWASVLLLLTNLWQQLGLGAILFAVLLYEGAQTGTLAIWAPLLL